MNTAEIAKAKEAERQKKIRFKKKNELIELKGLHKFLSDKHKPILTEFESGHDEKKHIYVTPKPTTTQTTTNSSSKTEATECDIFYQGVTCRDCLSLKMWITF